MLHRHLLRHKWTNWVRWGNKTKTVLNLKLQEMWAQSNMACTVYATWGVTHWTRTISLISALYFMWMERTAISGSCHLNYVQICSVFSQPNPIVSLKQINSGQQTCGLFIFLSSCRVKHLASSIFYSTYSYSSHGWTAAYSILIYESGDKAWPGHLSLQTIIITTI